VLLTALYAPFWSAIDTYKIVFHLIVCFVATTPWDAHLIRIGVWSYPADAVYGPAPLGIPLEEYFFFFIQTWTTSMLYLLLSKPVFQPGHLVTSNGHVGGLKIKWLGRIGQLALLVTFAVSVATIRTGGTGTYMGLILAWCTPFFFLLWYVYP
jgi:15-cis-phytoene synthase / lycopene beta-cyclase